MLRSGRTHLRIAYRTTRITIYSVPSPRPLVTAPARVARLGYSTITLAVPKRGTYHLAVRYTPYWRARAACLSRAPDGMTRLDVRKTGLVVLRFDVTPSRALAQLAGLDAEPCSG